MPTARRSIHDIMYQEEEELDMALLQPPLFKPIFPEDQGDYSLTLLPDVF